MSLMRKGLDKLLSEFPDAEVAWAENQHKDIMLARREARMGPWTCVDLFESGELRRFAIWNETGDVYRLDEHGAVEDDPFLTP